MVRSATIEDKIKENSLRLFGHVQQNAYINMEQKGKNRGQKCRG